MDRVPADGAVSVEWSGDHIVLVDQRALPHELALLPVETVDELIEAIRVLAVRGAPAIGIAGALGVALAALRHDCTTEQGRAAVAADAERIADARPTAVNLRWAVRRALARLAEGPAAVLDEALRIRAEDAATNRRLADTAADLTLSLAGRQGGLRVLTHCNTGRFATAAVGTALGAILELARRGRIVEVLVDETRPLLQGSRLTAFELREAGVAHRLLPDSAAAFAMARG
ncbi:MAG: bifunctional S-methyl-5-thioribose-1-phosphate isomerase/methylthioribulose 1-phosphate dehydratase, partial [Mycobacteriaceae bacterium]|nr:bifunctional S-methyl-5-thioribose-1-phosphate isomerase/methylthioribulose 1-phosphate dehydratase [Mycobacteriaceae bacterium]